MTYRALALIASLALASTSVGCSDDATTTPSTTDSGTSDTGTSDTSTSTGDTGTSTNDTGTPPPATDITFDADFIGDNGPNFITGTITLPAGAAAGRRIQFEVISTKGGNQVGPAGMTGAGSTLTYKVTGLAAGTYKIGIRVDQTNNGMVNDSGDYIGFARGTVASPKTTSAAADPIDVSAPVSGVDFGIGVVP